MVTFPRRCEPMHPPFPGMDPYLEARRVWPGFHLCLSAGTLSVLNEVLVPRGYYADGGHRVLLADPGRPIYPDIGVVDQPGPRDPAGDSAGTAVLDTPVRVARVDFEVREYFVEVRDAGNRLITGIEFLSPANKTDPRGRTQYRRKQREMETHGVHLIEVDLLRDGPEMVDLPDRLLERTATADYVVNVARRDSADYEFYPFGLRDRLPRLGVPLTVPDGGDVGDAPLDLGEAFRRAWAMGGYPLPLDYAAEPPPPALSPDDAAWLDGLLKEQNLRS